MTNLKSLESETREETLSIPAFGYELLREELLPSILGKETAAILYWAGKDLARKYPLQNEQEIIDFFEDAGWGQLIMKESAKNELQAELSSSLIAERLNHRDTTTFQLEAGFLAQQLQNQKGVIAECYEHPKKRASKVLFTIKWDYRDSRSS